MKYSAILRPNTAIFIRFLNKRRPQNFDSSFLLIQVRSAGKAVYYLILIIPASVHRYTSVRDMCLDLLIQNIDIVAQKLIVPHLHFKMLSISSFVRDFSKNLSEDAEYTVRALVIDSLCFLEYIQV